MNKTLEDYTYGDHVMREIFMDVMDDLYFIGVSVSLLQFIKRCDVLLLFCFDILPSRVVVEYFFSTSTSKSTHE